jgi:hypothetical protein
MATGPRRRKDLKAKYVSTLVYVDEPQVVLLDRGDNVKVIGVAIEKDGFDYPFLGAEISLNQFERYRRNFVDLRYLLTYPHWNRWYIFDLNSMTDNEIALHPAEQEDFNNEEHLPSQGFFASSHTVRSEHVVAGFAREKYGLDGNWLPIDISKWFGRATDLYAFFFSIRRASTKGSPPRMVEAIKSAFKEHPFRGGSSYVNFYRDLFDVVPFEQQLAVGAIEKKSPGYVEIAGEKEILGDISVALGSIFENLDDLETSYVELHTYLSALNLLTTGPEAVRLTAETKKNILDKCKEFAAKLGVDFKTIYDLTENREVSAAKILLSHYRRLRRYFWFFAEGRVRSTSAGEFVANSPSIDAIPDA